MERKKVFERRVLPLSLYYAALQLLHFCLLTRAGIVYLASGRMPFPAFPPQGGWPESVIPFLLGMGAVDGLAALLTVYLALRYLVKKHYSAGLWLVTLSAALSSAAVFCFGTLPSGAWAADPLGYGSLVVFFAPLPVLFSYLLRFSLEMGKD
jgi:hypothetical protein